jgi:hypothetical protein
MKFAIAVCAFLIMAIIASDDGAERQRRAADARISNNYTIEARRAS